MKKTIKKVFILLICAILLSLSVISSYALDSQKTLYRWNNIYDMSLDIYCSDGTGSASGALIKQSGVTLVEGTVTVDKYVNGSWVYVDSQYKSTTRNLSIDITFVAESGIQYRATFEATAYRGTVGESHTITKYKTCP